MKNPFPGRSASENYWIVTKCPTLCWYSWMALFTKCCCGNHTRVRRVAGEAINVKHNSITLSHLLPLVTVGTPHFSALSTAGKQQVIMTLLMICKSLILTVLTPPGLDLTITSCLTVSFSTVIYGSRSISVCVIPWCYFVKIKLNRKMGILFSNCLRTKFRLL